MDVPKDITIRELFTEFGPNMAKGAIALGGRVDELAGTKFTLVMEVDSDATYRYIVTDGTEFDIAEGDLDDAMVRIRVSKADLEKMIAENNLDMLLGIQNDLSKTKYDALSRLKGKMVAKLTNPDSSEYTIEAIFAGQDKPAATFRLSTADSAALINKETNPVQLFMSGAMKIEGDMPFAMSTQPLFT